MTTLGRGDRLPEIVTPPPGPRSRRLCQGLARWEAPGINTLYRGEPGPVWAEAAGANVLDVDGNRFLDLTAGFGVAAVGHRHPRVVAAIAEQSARLLHGLGDVQAHPGRERLAERLCRLAPVDDPQVYFGISGSEAVEIALKTALLATDRPEVVAFAPAYHGLTLGALAATSRPAFRQPFERWLGVPVHRLRYGCEPAELAALLDDRPAVGAVLLEPVAGREGVLFPSDGWLSAVAATARQRSVLVIADEIFTGFGRTGRWFGVDHEGVRPDLLVCGKALGAGLPIAAVVGRRELLAHWTTPGEALHTATFVANPLACAAALAALDVFEDERLPERARRLGETVAGRMAGLGAHPLVATVRGRGLLWGVELTSAEAAAGLALDLLARGVLALAGGAHGTVLQVAPPLTISEEQLDHALGLLGRCLEGRP